MKIPRIILNPTIRPWIMLWQRERKENARLRRELREWQGKFLLKVQSTPLFEPAVKTVSIQRPPIGITQKRAFVAQNGNPNAEPTAEYILAQAGNAKKP